jgi:hypothetical protein
MRDDDELETLKGMRFFFIYATETVLAEVYKDGLVLLGLTHWQAGRQRISMQVMLELLPYTEEVRDRSRPFPGTHANWIYGMKRMN